MTKSLTVIMSRHAPAKGPVFFSFPAHQFIRQPLTSHKIAVPNSTRRLAHREYPNLATAVGFPSAKAHDIEPLLQRHRLERFL